MLRNGLKWGALLLSSSMVLSAHTGWARGEITQMLTHERPATPSQYVKDGVVYQWGQGNDVIIDGFVYQGRTYDYQRLADRVEVKRVDNSRAHGNRCSVFVETVSASLQYAPSYPSTSNAQGNCDMASLIGGNVINMGALDVFSNAGQRPDSIKNIERVDFIVDKGLHAAASALGLQRAGHVVIEKSGNNPVQMAAITALDANGEPAAYGPLIRINNIYTSGDKLRYGLVAPERDLDFLATENRETPSRLAYSSASREPLGMVFVSQATLGLADGQHYYGFSVFPSDVDPAIHTLTDPSTFPRDSKDTQLNDPGDADFFAAFALGETSNQPPQAQDDFAQTTPGVSVDIDLLANDRDPDGDVLTVSLLTPPQHGAVNLVDGLASYTPDPDFFGKEVLTYQLDDGFGGQDTAQLTISVPKVKDEASGRITTGLQGHGAGSFDWLLLASLGLLARMRRRTFAG